MQVVGSFASSSKCDRLPPNKENAACVNVVSKNCASVDGRKVMMYASHTTTVVSNFAPSKLALRRIPMGPA